MDQIRVALLGGAPPPLGGGGLERQMERTSAALRARGHSVEIARAMPAEAQFDVVHAIGNGADIWQNLQHWRRRSAPLVVSPVIVCSPGMAEVKLRIGARLGRIPNVNSMTRDVLRHAQHVIALTEYERQLVEKLAGPKEVTVIDNGVDRVAPASNSPVPVGEPYVLMLGSISPRKRQAEVVEQLAGDLRFVVVGGVEGGEAETEAWAAIAAPRATWTGEIEDPAVVARVISDAGALLLFSHAEVQSLAVLEALAYGTPVVASELPSHRELARRFPGWVTPVASIKRAGPALRKAIESPPAGPAPAIPSWDDVAAKIEGVYERVLARTAS